MSELKNGCLIAVRARRADTPELEEGVDAS
jgi:hypothetical protein